MTELHPTLAQQLDRLRDLNHRIHELEVTAAAIKTELRAHLPTGEHTIGGKKALTITPNRRFDAKLATQALPPELLALCTVNKVDSATAKRVLPPAAYDACMTQVGDPVIRLA